MTPAAKPHEPPRRPARLLAGLFLAVALLAASGVIVSTGGCSKPPATQKGDPTANGPKGDPWKIAEQRLRKESDLTATRAALGGLTNDIAAQEGERLPALSPEALAALAAVVPLT